MTRKTINEIKVLAEKYKKYGVTADMLIMLAKKAPPELSELAIVTGLRMVLANEYHESETFTVEQVAACTGETVKEVEQRIKAQDIQIQFTQKSRTRYYS